MTTRYTNTSGPKLLTAFIPAISGSIPPSQIRLSSFTHSLSRSSSSSSSSSSSPSSHSHPHRPSTPTMTSKSSPSTSLPVYLSRTQQQQQQQKQSAAKNNTASIVWFRNDLRIHDNDVLTRAVRHSNGHILPVYCMPDTKELAQVASKFGTPRWAFHKVKFLLQALADLKDAFNSKGSDLLVLSRYGLEKGVPSLSTAKLLVDLINRIRQNTGKDLQGFPCIDIVFCQMEVADQELQEQNDLEKALAALKPPVKLVKIWNASTLVDLDDLPYDAKNLPNMFTQFRKSVENINPLPVQDETIFPPNIDLIPLDQSPVLSTIVPSLIQAFPLPEPQSISGALPSEGDEKSPINFQSQQESSWRFNAVLDFKGGEMEAWKRLEYYFWKTDALAEYKVTRNGLIGGDYSSKFSPWLAFGCITPRSIYHQVQSYEKERVENESTYWLIFELLWRDYFRFATIKYGASVFYPNGVNFRQKKHRWNQDPAYLYGWQYGQTGFPFVDANMRELLHTGFMSNRGRQNVASFLTKDLGVDWRLGAEWFEALLIDHDVCSNYGNWNYSAGIGDDPRQDRHFNVIRQAKTYDPQGDYVRIWVPELANIPGDLIHEPYKLSQEELQKYKVELGKDYPRPIVDSLDMGRLPLKGPGKAFAAGKKHEAPKWMKNKNKKGGRSNYKDNN